MCEQSSIEIIKRIKELENKKKDINCELDDLYNKRKAINEQHILNEHLKYVNSYFSTGSFINVNPNYMNGTKVYFKVLEANETSTVKALIIVPSLSLISIDHINLFSYASFRMMQDEKSPKNIDLVREITKEEFIEAYKKVWNYHYEEYLSVELDEPLEEDESMVYHGNYILREYKGNDDTIYVGMGYNGSYRIGYKLENNKYAFTSGAITSDPSIEKNAELAYGAILRTFEVDELTMINEKRSIEE